MLVVLAVLPLASPSESLRLEEAVAEVALLNHIGVVLGAVEVSTPCGWLYDYLAVLEYFMVRIVEGVDVDGKPLAVFGYRLGVRNGS